MTKFQHITNLPSKEGRYIVLDTETTGLFCDDNHIVEIAAIEIKNGYLTGSQFHAFIKPRKKIESKAQEKHKMNNQFYKENYEGTYESDKAIMQNLINFISDSLIFAHNATFDLQFVNHELNFWNLPNIPIDKFRCSMKIFKHLFDNRIFSKDIRGSSLTDCCNFFNIKIDDKNLHSAVYDALLTAKLINCIYEFLLKNPSYLNKRIVDNVSYFKNKGKNYGKKNDYSFLSGESMKNGMKNLDKIDKNEKNNLTNTQPNLQDSVGKTIETNPNFHTDSEKRLLFNNDGLKTTIFSHNKLMKDENNKNHNERNTTNISYQSYDGGLSAKKIKDNQEYEILLYNEKNEEEINFENINSIDRLSAGNALKYRCKNIKLLKNNDFGKTGNAMKYRCKNIESSFNNINFGNIDNDKRLDLSLKKIENVKSIDFCNTNYAINQAQCSKGLWEGENQSNEINYYNLIYEEKDYNKNNLQNSRLNKAQRPPDSMNDISKIEKLNFTNDFEKEISINKNFSYSTRNFFDHPLNSSENISNFENSSKNGKKHKNQIFNANDDLNFDADVLLEAINSENNDDFNGKESIHHMEIDKEYSSFPKNINMTGEKREFVFDIKKIGYIDDKHMENKKHKRVENWAKNVLKDIK